MVSPFARECGHALTTDLFSLAPWVATTSNKGAGSVSIVEPGFDSDHAIQLYAQVAPLAATAVSTLSQTFTICKAAPYQLQWSMVQSKGKTTYDEKDPYKPEAFVTLTAPNGVNHIMGGYIFNETGYNASVSTPGVFSQHLVSQWTTYKANFPNTQTGTWKLLIEWYEGVGASAKVPSTFKVLMDNFKVVTL